MDEAKRQCKNNKIILVMGDLNAKIGRGTTEESFSEFGFGERNEKEDK